MPTHASRIEQILDQQFLGLRSPGLVCAVAAEAHVTHYATRGCANLALQTPLSVGQVFPIGSITKSFAAAAVLLLRDEGRLELGQSPADFIPHLHTFWATTSLAQLLSMQSGLGADYGGSWAEQHLPLSNAELGERLARPVIAAAQPGVYFMYSSLGYMMLGRVISAAAGCDARDFISERFIRPLGMVSTSWAPQLPTAVIGYRCREGRFEQEAPFRAQNDGAVFGGLWSAVPDLSIWMDFLCSAHHERAGMYDRVLKRSSRLEMQRGVVLRPIEPRQAAQEPPPCRAYGFGLVNFQSPTEWTVGHGGAVPGFGAHMQWSPETGQGVVAMANLRYADLSGLCGRVLSLVSAAAPPRTTTVHPLVAQRAADLLTLISTWSTASAKELFTESFFVDYPEEYIASRFAELRDVCSDRTNLTISPGPPGEGLSAVVAHRDHQLFTLTLSPLEPSAIQEVGFVGDPIF